MYISNWYRGILKRLIGDIKSSDRSTYSGGSNGNGLFRSQNNKIKAYLCFIFKLLWFMYWIM